MRRCLPLLLAVMLLWGCAGADPEESALPSTIRIEVLTEQTDFSGFLAAVPAGATAEAAEMVESALAEYPRSLLEQLGQVRFLLAGELTGEGEFSRGNYGGFAQRTEWGWQVVLDAAGCTAGTVHHELAHILDSILTAAGRLTEAEWAELNPSGFRYGEGDWAALSDFFVDDYAMTALTEDRATVFEAAVMGGEGVFQGKSPLWLKLHTFAQAIRDHFDTTGWPATTIWELALK